MTYINTLNFVRPFAVLSALTLTACSADSPAPTEQSSAVELRVTAEVNTGVNARHITVIPNDVAPWLSHIILIDDTGALYRTALDSGAAKPLNMKAVDAVGLMRQQAAGVVLTLSETGTVSALIESDDEGNLSPLPVSSSVSGLARFCQTEAAPSDTVYAMDDRGAIVSLAVLVDDTSQIILSETNRSIEKPDATHCFNYKGQSFWQTSDSFVGAGGRDFRFQLNTDSTGQIALLPIEGPLSVLQPMAPADGLSLQGSSGVAAIAVKITSGLSTPGIDVATAVHATSDSLGGAFRDGAIIIADADAPRLVMISRSFAQKTLATPSASTESP